MNYEELSDSAKEVALREVWASDMPQTLLCSPRDIESWIEYHDVEFNADGTVREETGIGQR